MKVFKDTQYPHLEFEFRAIESTKSFEISVVMPIHNQENVIQEVILGLLRSITSDFELILIDDASTDDTLHVLFNLEHLFRSYPHLRVVRVYRNHKPKFETYCDSFGFAQSNCKYILEIQADMLLDDKGFEKRLIRALQSEDCLVAISGRGVEQLIPVTEQYCKTLGTDRAHNTSLLGYVVERISVQTRYFLKQLIKSAPKDDGIVINPSLKVHQELSDQEFIFKGEAGRLGKKATDYISDETLGQNKIYLGETIMRGPVIFDRKKYMQVGALNSKAFFQGFDDHDFCARALLLGYRVGYTPVRYSSPLEYGTTRKPRTIRTEIEVFKNILRIQIKKNSSPLDSRKSLENALSAIRNEVKYF